MRIALISDIHGNRVALETVLAAVEQDAPDGIVCLGDVAVMGPDPGGTLDLLQSLDCPVIMGNADSELLADPAVLEANVDPSSQRELVIRDLILWTQSQLDERRRSFVESFVPVRELDLGWGARLLCFHGSPRSNTEIIAAETELTQLREAIDGSTATLLAGGHTHHQLLRRFDGQWLINPGSVGLTFRQTRIDRATGAPPWAEYGVVTVENGAIDVSLRAVPLDLDRVLAQVPDDMPHKDDWRSIWTADVV
jgi:predicted phosphodiesterase